jgi:hypothetical protein
MDNRGATRVRGKARNGRRALQLTVRNFGKCESSRRVIGKGEANDGRIAALGQEEVLTGIRRFFLKIMTKL